MSHPARANESSERAATFHQVLILLGLYLFGGGGGGDSLEDRVKEVVGKERRAAARAIAAEIEHEIDNHRELLVDRRHALLEVVQRYDATPDELQAACEPGVTEAERIQTVIVDARFRLRDALSAEEWEELFTDQEAWLSW